MQQIMLSIQAWDEQTILRVIAQRGRPMTAFMKGISLAGDGHVWGALAILFFVLTDVHIGWLLTGLTAFAIELTCYKLIKQSTTRQRPFRRNPDIRHLVEPQDEYSFPSGHTAAAVVAALLFGTALPVLMPLFLSLAVLIGISRIYLGVHYPSDVMMGSLLGAVSFTCAYLLF